MNRFFIVSVTMVLGVGVAMADPAEIIKQKALGIRDMNNQRQGIIAGGNSSPAPAAAPTPAAPSGPSNEQQALIDRLQRDLAGIKVGAPVSPELSTGLQNDISSLSKGAMKPTKPEVAKLVADLSAAFTNKTLSPVDMAQIARDINISVNCAVLTPARATTFVSAAQVTLRNGGIGDQASQAVSADLQAIVNEIQKNKPKLYQ